MARFCIKCGDIVGEVYQKTCTSCKEIAAEKTRNRHRINEKKRYQRNRPQREHRKGDWEGRDTTLHHALLAFSKAGTATAYEVGFHIQMYAPHVESKMDPQVAGERFISDMIRAGYMIYDGMNSMYKKRYRLTDKGLAKRAELVG